MPALLTKMSRVPKAFAALATAARSSRATLPLNDFACICQQNPLSNLLCPFWIILSRMAVQRDSFPGCPTRSFFLSLWFSQPVHRQRKALDGPTSGLSAIQKKSSRASCRISIGKSGFWEVVVTGDVPFKSHFRSPVESTTFCNASAQPLTPLAREELLAIFRPEPLD